MMPDMSFGPHGTRKTESKALRKKVFAELDALGFRVAKSLPYPDMGRSVRPADEIAARMMALDALLIWVSLPGCAMSTRKMNKHIDGNHLRDGLTAEESEILALPRDHGRVLHFNTIGWKLENMWSLAWVLGFHVEPGLKASQIGNTVTDRLYEFLPWVGGTLDELLAKCSPRSADEVIALEYRFYCAHNAVRSAQLGHKSVPKRFDPLAHGGATQERRHALTWCLSPGVAWDQTDLST